MLSLQMHIWLESPEKMGEGTEKSFEVPAAKSLQVWWKLCTHSSKK